MRRYDPTHVAPATIGLAGLVLLYPVKAGIVLRPEDWRGSSVHDYTGTVNAPSGKGSPISIDRIMMPIEERRRI
jgi:hypothetical protein